MCLPFAFAEMFWSKRNFGFPSDVLGMAGVSGVVLPSRAAVNRKGTDLRVTDTFPAVRGELIPAPG